MPGPSAITERRSGAEESRDGSHVVGRFRIGYYAQDRVAAIFGDRPGDKRAALPFGGRERGQRGLIRRGIKEAM